MPSHFSPDLGAGAFAMDTASSTSSGTSSTLMDDEDPYGVGVRTGEDRFRSLTDLKWGEFEIMGFGGLGTDEKKLQFDLTEGARNVSNLSARNSCFPSPSGFLFTYVFWPKGSRCKTCHPKLE